MASRNGADGDRPAKKPAKKRTRKTKSNKEVAQVVELTAIWLGQMTPKHEIKRRVKAKLKELSGEECHARTCEAYLARARELLIEWSKKPKEDHVIEAVGFYTSTIQHPGTSTMEKMQARGRLDALFGLDAPSVSVLRGDKDSPIALNVVGIVDLIAKAKTDAESYRKARFDHDGPAATNGHAANGAGSS